MSIRRKLRGAFRRRDLALRGHIDGLILSNDTDTDHDISMSAGEATLLDSVSSDFKVLGQNDSALVKRIDANWASGTGSGGFPSALTISSDTWYHFFAIAQSDGVLDAGFDTSIDATNLRSDATGYNHYRRVGSVLTDGSSNITSFVQAGDFFFWDDWPSTVEGSPSSTATLLTIEVPPDVNVLANIQIHITQQSGDGGQVTTPLISTEAATSVNSATTAFGDQTGSLWVMTNTSSQFRYTHDDSDGQFDFQTVGWKDPRGRTWT